MFSMSFFRESDVLNAKEYLFFKLDIPSVPFKNNVHGTSFYLSGFLQPALVSLECAAEQRVASLQLSRVVFQQ